MLSKLRFLCIVLCICDVTCSACMVCQTIFGKQLSVLCSLCIILFLSLEQCLSPTSAVNVVDDSRFHRAALIHRRMQAVNWCLISRKAEAMLRMRWMLDMAHKSGSRVLRRTISDRAMRRVMSDQTGFKSDNCERVVRRVLSDPTGFKSSVLSPAKTVEFH